MLREIAVGLLLSVIPQWMAATYADTPPAAGEERKIVVVRASADPNDGSVTVTAPDGNVHAYAFVASGEGGAADEKKEVRVFAVGNPSIDDKEDAERGWLGVSIGNVPSVLKAQLNTDEKGVLILNVVKDSPADRAGLQEHDVLVAIDGQALDGYKNAVDAIRARKPGETIALRIIRDGQEQTLRAALISRAGQSAAGFNWKFENTQDADIEDQVNTRGHIILRGPKGEWTMKNLGDLHELKNLPENIRKMIPKSGTRTVQIQRDGDEQNIRVNVERDGSTIIVHQSGDQIGVQRVDKDGNQTNAHYDSEDELKAADEEAYALLQGAGQGTVHLNLDGDDFDWDGDLDIDAFHGNIEEWRAQLEESMKGAKDAYQDSMQEMERLMAELHGQGLGGALHGRDGDAGPAFFHGFSFGKPKQSFETRADGSIQVKVRKGDSELVRNFSNEADLQRRDPELYTKYQDLMNAEK